LVTERVAQQGPLIYHQLRVVESFMFERMRCESNEMQNFKRLRCRNLTGHSLR